MRININCARLFFDVEGSKLVVDGPEMREKPSLILLHGAPGLTDHTSFKPRFSALADTAQLIYLDLSGAGRSDPTPDGQYSLDRWADDLVAFCDALEIEKPVVLGVSGGGFVAAAYAIRHPEHPGKLVLASTQARLDPARCAAVFERLGGSLARDAALEMLTRRFDLESMTAFAQHCMPLYNRTPQDPDGAGRSVFRRELSQSFHEVGGIWHTMNLLPELHRIQCPTLILAGEEDRSRQSRTQRTSSRSSTPRSYSSSVSRIAGMGSGGTTQSARSAYSANSSPIAHLRPHDVDADSTCGLGTLPRMV